MAFLSNPATPWLIAVVTFVIGLIFWRSAREHSGRPARIALSILGLPLLALGSLMLIGAGVAAWKFSAARVAYPMQGKLVDVGGHRIHLTCEGPASALTVLWLSGGYSQGLWLANQHEALKGRNRSCLIDPAGTGWSDAGPFPRTMERIIDDAHRALIAGGERGPFVYAGHSWGGAIAMNIAAKYPADTAGLLLIDPTAPLWQLFYAALGCPASDAGPAVLAGTMFGLAYINALNPLRSPSTAVSRNVLGQQTWEALVVNELRPVARLSNRSSDEASCHDPFSSILAPASLGDIPLLLITQKLTREDRLKWADPHLSPFERTNFLAFNDYAGRQSAGLSRRSQIVYAPVGSGHLIPHTEPAFIQEQLDQFLAALAAGQFPPLP
jgi:pimeloyl-ACP methyl ester carboxylesterase